MEQPLLPVAVKGGKRGRHVGTSLAQEVWARGGLAVTRVLGQDFAVTHVSSGYAVFKGMSSKRNAVAAAESLLPMADWTVPRDALVGDQSLHDNSLALADRLHKEGRW